MSTDYCKSCVKNVINCDAIVTYQDAIPVIASWEDLTINTNTQWYGRVWDSFFDDEISMHITRLLYVPHPGASAVNTTIKFKKATDKVQVGIIEPSGKDY